MIDERDDFGIHGYTPDAECVVCEKVTACIGVRCALGSFAGPTCAKCLFKAVKLRDGMKKQGAPDGTPRLTTSA